MKLCEMFRVNAKVRNTGLDGSLVQLLVDGQPSALKRIWARGGESRDVAFQLWLGTCGTHSLQIGDQKATIAVTA